MSPSKATFFLIALTEASPAAVHTTPIELRILAFEVACHHHVSEWHARKTPTTGAGAAL